MLNHKRNGLWLKSPPHCALANVIYYHLEMCNNLPNYKWANNIIDNAMPPICQASELPWFITKCLAIEDEQPSATT
jgi:hypothetical protein